MNSLDSEDVCVMCTDTIYQHMYADKLHPRLWGLNFICGKNCCRIGSWNRWCRRDVHNGMQLVDKYGADCRFYRAPIQRIC